MPGAFRVLSERNLHDTGDDDTGIVTRTVNQEGIGIALQSERTNVSRFVTELMREIGGLRR